MRSLQRPYNISVETSTAVSRKTRKYNVRKNPSFVLGTSSNDGPYDVSKTTSLKKLADFLHPGTSRASMN